MLTNQCYQKCKRYIIVFNGEIYNSDKFRNRLLNMGVKFNSHSDTEVLLNGLILIWLDSVLEK